MSRELAVVVPVYNGEETVAACLDALVVALPVGAELIVVDDGSTDSTAAIVEGYPARLLRHGDNRGTSAARNTGWRATDASLVAFVDADVVVEEGALASLVDRLDADCLGANGLLSLELGAPGRVTAFANTSIHYQHLAHGERVASAFTSICLLRRSALEQMGGWDERLYSRYADDVVTRFFLPPGSIQLVPQARGEHLKSVGLRGLLKHRYNIGWFYVRSARANSDALRERPRTAVLALRYPLNTVAAALALGAAGPLLVLGPFGLPALAPAVAVSAAANLRFCAFTLKHRGPVDAALAWPLSAAEGFAYLAGMLGSVWSGREGD